MTLNYENGSGVKYRVESLAESIFDQQNYRPEELHQRFLTPEWMDIADRLKQKGIQRLLPATENGFRNVAAEQFAIAAEMELLSVPGSEREMTWEKYLKIVKKPLPDEYQVAVAQSKNGRATGLSILKKNILTITTPDKMEEKTAMIAFDTVIWKWEGNQYVRREKPKSRREALETIELVASGETFLVCTAASATSMTKIGEFGNSATFLPVRIVTNNRFERMALVQEMTRLHDQIMEGNGGKWKITPTGTASLMHPSIQPFVQVAVGDQIMKNVLPSDFTTYEEVTNTRLNPSFMPSQSYAYKHFEDTGHLAYKKFADQLESKYGFMRLDCMTDNVRQQIGMIVSGYSEIGLKVALERYLAHIGREYSILLMSHKALAITGD